MNGLTYVPPGPTHTHTSPILLTYIIMTEPHEWPYLCVPWAYACTPHHPYITHLYKYDEVPVGSWRTLFVVLDVHLSAEPVL